MQRTPFRKKRLPTPGRILLPSRHRNRHLSRIRHLAETQMADPAENNSTAATGEETAQEPESDAQGRVTAATTEEPGISGHSGKS